MTERENILTKIKKLLTLAKKATNEHEAAQAASTAHKFMEKHNLCISDVDSISLDDTKIIKEEAHTSGRLATWKLSLLQHVARNFNCSVLIYSAYRSRTLQLVGTKTDVDVAKITFDYLVSAVEKFSKNNAVGMGRGYITSYKVGLVERLGERLREQARQNRVEVEEVATSKGVSLRWSRTRPSRTSWVSTRGRTALLVVTLTTARSHAGGWMVRGLALTSRLVVLLEIALCDLER